MEHKVIISDNTREVNELLKEGWRVVSVTAQHLDGFSYGTKGSFCFVLQKD